MKPLSPALADRAHAALTYVLDRVEHDEPETIIAGLIENHRATLRTVGDAHVLRCAGIVTSTNTGGQHAVLVSGWRKNAVLRLSLFI